MILSRYTAKNITTVPVPDPALFELPEKVLQFGTSVLLRGLPDYVIDKANKQGLFNGRIVAVTASAGDATFFEKQDGLFTQCLRDPANGKPVDENSLNAAISRVLLAGEQWEQVLECAHNPHLQIVISDGSEMGVELVNDDIRQHPPKSFPGKLLAFLYERFKAFAGSEQSGIVMVSADTVPDNGEKLQAVVFELAHLNGLEDRFIEWLEQCNRFCNSVLEGNETETNDEAERARMEQQLGYTDPLLLITNNLGRWTIEGDEKVRTVLSFAGAGDGVVVKPALAQTSSLSESTK